MSLRKLFIAYFMLGAVPLFTSVMRTC